METRRINPEEAAARLLEADNILILTHKNPDGDAIGSGIAIALALQQKQTLPCLLDRRIGGLLLAHNRVLSA